jgi:hypothetical protein
MLRRRSTSKMFAGLHHGTGRYETCQEGAPAIHAIALRPGYPGLTAIALLVDREMYVIVMARDIVRLS